jgi:hypothetical protein
MLQFKFFHGYKEKTLTEQWEELMEQFPISINEWNNIHPITYNPVWRGRSFNPTWQINPGLVQYTLPNYTQYTQPNYTQYTPPNYTITTTPGTGYVTIPYNGATHFTTTGTATGFNLTTSNPNGITYTTGGIGGTITTGTATFRSGAFTTKFR